MKPPSRKWRGLFLCAMTVARRRLTALMSNACGSTPFRRRDDEAVRPGGRFSTAVGARRASGACAGLTDPAAGGCGGTEARCVAHRAIHSMRAADHRFTLEPGSRPSAPDKKSVSRASCPPMACSSLISAAVGSTSSNYVGSSLSIWLPTPSSRTSSRWKAVAFMLLALPSRAPGSWRLSAIRKQLFDAEKEDTGFCLPACLGDHGK